MKKRKENEIMTVKQVAEYLQMDEHTIYKLARSGQIPSINPALSKPDKQLYERYYKKVVRLETTY
ncbi:MAG: helix-turn-helix domain-containing protein [Candidatus Aminicenantes bacterium]|nr:helix-turn-helix domain-containing protein [Candidatus Aminicenantes bacterium]